jgi:hypothetical protein
MSLRPGRLGLALLVLIAAAGTAAADKPTAAQAMQAAKAWLAALDGGKPDAAAPHTASSLFAVAYTDTGPKCKAATATTPAAIAKALACLQDEVQGAGELAPWSKAAAKELAGPLAKLQKKKLAELEGTATLVHFHEKCVGEGRDLVIAVALEAPKDKGKDKPAPKVTAVLAAQFTCGE